MEVADLPANRTKKTRLILFREHGDVGAAPSLKASCKQPQNKAVGSKFHSWKGPHLF